MSNFKRALALFCVFALLIGIVAMLAGCDGDKPTEPSGESTGPTATKPIPGQNTSYVINVKTATGIALSNVTILVYKDEALTELAGYGQTDDNGQAVVTMPGAVTYYAALSNVKEGYVTDASYPLTATVTDISLKSQLIADTDLTGVSYELGSVMHDFTITDTEGNEYTLSKLLEQKDMVMLNFWYTSCTYCVQEFPYMDSTYQEYSDSIEIIALNPYTSDTAEDVKDFKDNFYATFPTETLTSGGLSMPMAKDDTGIAGAFDLEGFPTSVVIDRYGVICMIHAGGLIGEDFFYYIYDAFVGEDYTQVLYESFDELVPVIKPTEQMPSSEEVSAVLDGGKLGATYTPEPDDEMSWPFLIGEKNGEACLYPSNMEVTDSYATMYAKVNLKAGQALALDYFASSEANADVLYVLVDRNDIYQLSGQSEQWSTCYPWVAPADGEYEIAFCYYKDSTENVGDDTVYIKNLRIVDVADIDVPSYIPRFAATNLKADGFGYENYITPVFNEKDGYYHVGTADGPLLLANLMMATQFSNTPIYSHAYNGEITIDGVNYYDAIVSYCSYASNSQIYSLVPVTEELKQLLIKVTQCIGLEQNDTEWLQICEYYDAYGTGGVQLSDPTVGLSAHSAYIAQLGNNSFTYDRVIMPRGLLAKFVPEKSGVYRISSFADNLVEGWLFMEDGLKQKTPFYTYWFNERAWTDFNNVSMVVYMEAGKEYYIDIAYADVYGTGTINYTVEYVGESLKYLVLAAPGYFTYEEGAFVIDALGIDVALGTDGYYHELLSDGTHGSQLYVDMTSPSTIFTEQSITELIASGAFDFRLTEDDQWVLDYYDYFESLNFNGADFETCMKDVWGDDFDTYWQEFEVESVLAGNYHGTGADMTEIMRGYAAKIYTEGELAGCVAVNEELASVLQMLMDKYTFSDVDHSWTKLCYYYDYLGPES